MPTPDAVPHPWSAFFSELDSALREEVWLHCIGGFVVSVRYGLNRPRQFAGAGSQLHRKHGAIL